MLESAVHICSRSSPKTTTNYTISFEDNTPCNFFNQPISCIYSRLWWVSQK